MENMGTEILEKKFIEGRNIRKKKKKILNYISKFQTLYIDYISIRIIESTIVHVCSFMCSKWNV